MILIPILNEQPLKTIFLVYERAISSSLGPNKNTGGIINTTPSTEANHEFTKYTA